MRLGRHCAGAAFAATLHQKVVVTGVGDIWRTRGARAYNRGLGTEPPAGSRGRAPGGGSGGEPPEAERFLAKQRQSLYINFPHLLHICKGW